MSEDDDRGQGVYHLTIALGVQLRLNGLILETLIARDVISRTEAAGLVADALSHLPEDNPASPIFETLLRQFRLPH
jgi:hypothetical protein